MTTITTQQHPKRPLVRAAAGTLAILAIVAGIATWQATRHSTAPHVHPAADAGPVVRDHAATAVARNQGLTVYIATSEAHARAVQAAIVDAEAVRPVLGASSGPTDVLWFDAAETEARFWQAVGAGDAILASLGLPPLSFIDLRPGA